MLNRAQSRIYEMYRGKPPRHPDGDPDRSSGIRAAYWKGREHPDKQQYNRTSLAHAAWKAGRDDAKKGERKDGRYT